MTKYGAAPEMIAPMPNLDLREVMYYLYLPVFMADKPRADRETLLLPPNVECCRHLIDKATIVEKMRGRTFRYIYLSARKGWATPDNPLNRPGWHCDGFGTDDMNYVWWKGPGTRFALGDFGEISDDHTLSQEQFEATIALHGHNQPWQDPAFPIRVSTPPEGHIYRIDPFVVHATPLIETPCWRQYVKVSFSNHRYNLENNSHNYLFDYDWALTPREDVRNDTHKAQRDYA